MRKILAVIITIIFMITFLGGCSINKATLKEIAKYKQEILIKSNQYKYEEGSVFEDIIYKRVDKEELKLDIYMPNKISYEKSPVIIYVHGGFWAYGNKRAELPFFTDLINIIRNKGITFVSIDYRLANEDKKFPDPVEDVKDAVRWIRKNANKYNIDPDKIGICGNSAGGHLALMEGVTDDNMYLGDDSLRDFSSKVDFIVSFFSPTDLSLAKGKRNIRIINKFIGGTIEDINSSYIDASPIYHIKEGNPPILLIHGKKDNIVPISQSESLYKKAKELGIDIEFIPVENAGHGLISTGGKINPSLTEISEKIISFIEENFKDEN